MNCPCCGAHVGPNHPAFRGFLINTIASLGARIIETRDKIKLLRSKRWNKQFAEQRKRELETLARLEAELPELEGRFHGLRFLEGEMANRHKVG